MKVVEEIGTHILFSITFVENRAVHEIMWKNVGRGKPQMTLWRMRIARIPKATNTHSGCVILIAFPPVTMVAGTHLNVTLYVHCLSCSWFSSVLRRGVVMVLKLYDAHFLSNPNLSFSDHMWRVRWSCATHRIEVCGLSMTAVALAEFTDRYIPVTPRGL